MSDSKPALEDLVESVLPSAMPRQDLALTSAGVAAAEIGASRDALAAVAIAGATPVAPPAALRERLLASASRGGKYGVFADRIARLFDLPLTEASELMARIETPEAWTPFLVDGLELIPVPAGKKCEGAIATLVRLQPGARFPDHAHRGDETMFVLDGGFHEPPSEGGDGQEVWRGDEIFRADGTEHALVGLPGVPCIAAILIFGFGDFK